MGGKKGKRPVAACDQWDSLVQMFTRLRVQHVKGSIWDPIDLDPMDLDPMDLDPIGVGPD